MPGEEVEKGDKVSWQWGSGAPSGVVEKKTEGEISIESNKGNTITKNAEPENPAVHIGREGNDVVKKTSELTVLEKNVNGEPSEEEPKEESKEEPKAEPKEDPKEESKEEPKPEELQKNGDAEARVGEKRDRVEDTEPEKGEEKKLKTGPAPEQNGEAPAAKEAEPEKPEEPKVDAKEDADGDKKEKKRGRPKGAPKKAQKERPPPATEGIGSRTRSRAK